MKHLKVFTMHVVFNSGEQGCRVFSKEKSRAQAVAELLVDCKCKTLDDLAELNISLDLNETEVES